jgi:hypothetical protein
LTWTYIVCIWVITNKHSLNLTSSANSVFIRYTEEKHTDGGDEDGLVTGATYAGTESLLRGCHVSDFADHMQRDRSLLPRTLRAKVPVPMPLRYSSFTTADLPCVFADVPLQARRHISMYWAVYGPIRGPSHPANWGLYWTCQNLRVTRQPHSYTKHIHMRSLCNPEHSGYTCRALWRAMPHPQLPHS